MTDFRQDFLEFALARDVLRFGEFVTKAGRQTPYFFNAGLFNDGESLRRLGDFYAQAYLTSGVQCDQLFGPAYKGITLAAATAVALAEKGHNLPYSYNRKEAKDHGSFIAHRIGTEKPGMVRDRPLDVLSKLAREAPLGSLLAAFLIGFIVARR